MLRSVGVNVLGIKTFLKKNLRIFAQSAGENLNEFTIINLLLGFQNQFIMTENEISYVIRGAIFNVFNAFGPGLFESVYVAALIKSIQNEGLKAIKEVPVPVYFEGEKLEVGFRLDLLVQDKVIIEVKSVEHLAEVHHKQVLTYLKLTDLKLAILVNFNEERITDGIYRKVNGL